MPESNAVSGPNKILAAFIIVLAILAIAIGELFVGGAHAMNNSTTSPPKPYTGGAAISKVLYPADGSTVTITCTGAVIKQSPGHTAYREGWINPNNVGSINSSSDLKGQIAGGSTNPYGAGNNCPSTSSTNQSGATTQQQTAQPSTTVTTAPKAQTQTPSVSSSSNAAANANATVNLTGSTPATASAAAQAPASSTTPATTSATPAQNNNFTGKSLPNTGPGNVIAISGLATIFGTIGHFVYQRFRYRSLV